MKQRIPRLYKLYRRYESDLWGDLYMKPINFKMLIFFSFVFIPKYRFGYFNFDVARTQRRKRIRNISTKMKFFMDKQRVKFFYGNMSEQAWKQISNGISYKKKRRIQEYHFLLELERRLDTLIYRFFLASTILEAREKVHWFLVDGKSRNTFSYRLRDTQTLTFAHPRQIMAIWKRGMKEERYGKRLNPFFPALPARFWVNHRYLLFRPNPILTREQFRVPLPFSLKMTVAQHVGQYY